ncbi:hypothetical protein OPQ81_009010 [Rhizoctonia solani]|nr:hypothetical protein OPQ81_009010 [Rhizoctonia solani]
MTVLRLCNLIGLIKGTDLKPKPLTEDEAKESVKVSDHVELVKKWTTQNNDAHAQIVLSMDNGALAEVMETTTAYKAWMHIVEHWEGKGMQSLTFLYHQLTTMKIEEDEDLTMGFNNLCSIALKMKTLGEPISNLMLAQIFMKALPASYAIMSTVISSANQNLPIMSDQVIKAATTEEECHKQGVGLTAMFLHTSIKMKTPNLKSSHGLKGKKKANKGPACMNCAKPGHMKQECWAKGGGAKGTGPRQKKQVEKEAKEKAKEGAKTELAKVAITTEDSPCTHPYALLLSMQDPLQTCGS